MATMANKKALLWCSWTVSIDLEHTRKPVFAKLGWFVVLTNRSDAYRSPDLAIFVLQKMTDKIDYFTPCACIQGKNDVPLTIWHDKTIHILHWQSIWVNATITKHNRCSQCGHGEKYVKWKKIPWVTHGENYVTKSMSDSWDWFMSFLTQDLHLSWMV